MDTATTPVSPAHALAHQHHVAVRDAEAALPDRTPTGSVGAPSRHACNESKDLPARLASPAGQRAEKSGITELPLVLTDPDSSVVDRWHRDRAFSPPRPAERPLVLRV